MKNLVAILRNLPSHIGVVDSGIGGISALNALAKSGIQHVVYVADTAYLPYGQQPYNVLLERAQKITEFLLQRNITTIVIACHTLSATVLAELQKLYPTVTFVDLLVLTVLSVVNVTTIGNIGVLATQNTVQSQRFPAMICQFNPRARIIQQACPDFVPLLEAPVPDMVLIDEAIERYLEPIMNANIDTLVLGCTHYAFLSDRIQKRLSFSCVLVSAYSSIDAIFINNKKSAFTVDFYISGNKDFASKAITRVIDPILLKTIQIFDFKA